MKAEYLTLSYLQLLLASSLMITNIFLAYLFKLGLIRTYLLAMFRMTLQLGILGYLLHWIFSRQNPWEILGLTAVMVIAASHSSLQRVSWHYKGIFMDSLLAILFAAYFVTSLTVIGILRLEPWYTPQYLIPLLGMVLGNCLNGISLGLDTFLIERAEKADRIEEKLALGATPWEACSELIRRSMHVGMTPIINSMMVVGLVSLPGMMTGQILAGISPIEAVKYQLVIMFMIAAGTALGTLGILLFAFRHSFNSYGQVLKNLYSAKKK
ncbi:MAG: iron export ABC transporter permease subunit FetB [Planctomycetota bacterium]|nr:MAG: iron export ABC transporter permease subunit FetB [Planctomycetota bacterium]